MIFYAKIRCFYIFSQFYTKSLTSTSLHCYRLFVTCEFHVCFFLEMMQACTRRLPNSTCHRNVLAVRFTKAFDLYFAVCPQLTCCVTCVQWAAVSVVGNLLLILHFFLCVCVCFLCYCCHEEVRGKLLILLLSYMLFSIHFSALRKSNSQSLLLFSVLCFSFRHLIVYFHYHHVSPVEN